MDLGAFSISLNVKDISASNEFYEAIGFSVFHGEMDQNWLIIKNKTATLGLLQGRCEKNSLTFNPGWDTKANKIEGFLDIREVQKKFQEKESTLQPEQKRTVQGQGI